MIPLIVSLQTPPILTSPPTEGTLTDILVRKPSSSSVSGDDLLWLNHSVIPGICNRIQQRAYWTPKHLFFMYLAVPLAVEFVFPKMTVVGYLAKQ